MKRTLFLSVLACVAMMAMGREYHVTKTGNDAAEGSMAYPLRTVNAAAQKALPGDTVTVHEGTYREWVNPLYGGIDDARRILYRAAEGERVELKGSEPVKEWKKGKDGVWTVCLPNGFFGNYNPFAQKIEGDWFRGQGRDHHTAEVYLNDVSLYEVASMEEVTKPDTIRSLRDLEGSQLVWFAQVDAEHTTIYARFGKADPRKERVEVTTRPTCFYPTREGIDYLTIRGFHISQAATQWGAPTAEQIGIVGAHWCKGWIIEDNEICNSRCNGITLGKQCSTGHNLWTQRQFDGATEYIEVTMNALRKGWSRDHIGSHIIRNNEIHHCEQTGICGSMGGAFGEVYGNHIHDIWVKCQFDGEEISGIKFHAAIDAYIHNNYIHHCQKGLWMDWMAQGSRVSCNLMHDNVLEDIFYEVNHGPYVCDNNILLSACSVRDVSESGAYIHNLMGGCVDASGDARYTPYHLNHSTEIKGLYNLHCSDNRFYNNLFVDRHDGKHYGTAAYKNAEWPIAQEDNQVCRQPRVELDIQDGQVFLTFDGGEALTKGKRVESQRLGVAKLSNYPYENADGTPIRIDKDYLGKERPEEGTYVGPFEQSSLQKIRVW